MLYVQQWLRMDHTRGSGNWITVITERSMWTHFDGLTTKLLLKIFTSFWYVISEKKRKSHDFLNLKKNVKYIFSNSAMTNQVSWWRDRYNCHTVELIAMHVGVVVQGMVQAAAYISRKIKDEELLSAAFNSDPVMTVDKFSLLLLLL